jgi:hypothetical protein
VNNYYKKRIQNLPQNSTDLASLTERTGERRQLAILIDRRNWAYHDQAMMKAAALGDEWQVEFFFLEDRPVIDRRGFDLLFNFNHTPSYYDELFHGRLIKGLYSHYHHAALIPWRYVYRVVKHAAALVVANRAQAEEIKPFFTNTFELPDGVDTGVFYFDKERTGDDIIAGWSGNPDRRMGGRRVKRFYEVVEPACREAGVQLKTMVNLDREAMRVMYNETDVVLIASRTEGNPLSLLEAGACGRTVIATSVGIVPQIIEDGVDGFIIDSSLSDPETIRLMTSRLNWCKTHPAATRTMGRRLHEKIIRDRNAGTVGRAFRELLGNVYRV